MNAVALGPPADTATVDGLPQNPDIDPIPSPSSVPTSVTTTVTHQSNPRAKQPLESRSHHIQVLLKANEEILQKLETVRKTKAYEIVKYNRIQNMNASKVGEYLRSELRQPTSVQPTEYEKLQQMIRQKMENKAATVIQQYFRGIVLRKNIERRTKRWKNESPKERLKLIEEISDRLAKSKAPCRADLSIIKLRLNEWKQYRAISIREFEKRELLVKQIDRNLNFLEAQFGSETIQI